MSNIAQYNIKNINLLNIEERYTVCKILIFRDVPLQQSNNGVYTFTNNIDEDTESDMLTGITYQFISILFQVFSRLYMKISEGILAKHEVNLAGSFFTFFSTFLVTISIDASFQEWTVFENMSIMTWLIYGFISIMVFVVAFTRTVFSFKTF